MEIELDASIVKKQGKLWQARQQNAYEDVVGTFLNNVRTLVRVLDH